MGNATGIKNYVIYTYVRIKYKKQKDDHEQVWNTWVDL